MPKDKLSIEVDVEKLGVCTRHDLLVATDQEYRDACLTPQGGTAPGEGDKPADPVPGIDAVDKAALAAAAV